MDAGDLPVPATAVYHVNTDGSATITLTPQLPLATDLYLISVAGLSDLAGNPVSDSTGRVGPVYASFDDRPASTPGSPTVVSVTAENGAVAIHNNLIPQPDTIGIRFSKAMDPYTINGSTVQLYQQGVAGPLPALVASSPTTQSAYLTPETKLVPGAIYYVSVGTGVTDDEGFPGTGYPLAHAFATSFTAGAAPVGSGTSPLKVLQTGPQNGTLWPSALGYVSVTFSEALSTTLSQSILNRFSAMLIPQTGSALRGADAFADVPVNAKVAFNPSTNQLIIVPTGMLQNHTVYLIALSGIRAANGNALAGTVFSTFLLNTSTPPRAVPHSLTSTAITTAALPATSEPVAVVASTRYNVQPKPLLSRLRPAQGAITTTGPAGPRRMYRHR